ncbi:Phospholipid phosphatase [Sphingobium herbicidovorans NBRC 16415]|uniref:Phospholipid phosphatase n=1 Tax=Sphingobium herbicidovorans (strain ATCC 700291 / DSM 11019 / CCUG 56400 / KCTC 2939 / LMG 18315 / NBRC 16415 / MH) TaxID=1219045 RepID=A0A086P8P0_SPHHM|nr:phosphatase PAP2 family protein [Sphingobium herbicidovorans]KFG89758.1 Phospholipid phosphatase [Sphingobium herbicidovorans NBRC 16415]
MGARSISDRRSWLGGAGAFLLALVGVLAIALLQRSGVLDGLNIGAMTVAGEARAISPAITSIMLAASRIGDTVGRIAVIIAAVALLLWRGRRSGAQWLALVMAGGTLLNLGLKQLFAAPRPDLLPHLDIVHSYSFPSGHAAGNMMLFGALAMLAGRWGSYVLAGLLIALIGISRVWLGVHWPSDVLAGWMEGLGWLCLCRYWLPARGWEQQRIA